MRLEFYRQMNIFEFEEKDGSPSATDESKEDSKIEEIRRTVKRPTFGEDDLVLEVHLLKRMSACLRLSVS